MIIRSLHTPNFGDTLNVELVKLISGQVPTIVNNQFTNPNNELIYMVIGSILGWSDTNTEIWGSGFIQENQKIIPPKHIYAVRGELTRNELLSQGIKCPKIFGDPALLMPSFYNPTIEKKYDLSIILHHIDKPLKETLRLKYPKVHFIDIQQNVYKFIDEVLASKAVASSALHGLICSDSYNIPNIWIKVSDNILGNDFKFYDYFTSTKREDTVPLILNEKVHLGLF